MTTSNIAEVLYDSGQVHFRYARHLAPAGDRWIRNGLFQSFHKNGPLSAEDHYKGGVEEGRWMTYHEDGRTASERTYLAGREAPDWQFWNAQGEAE